MEQWKRWIGSWRFAVAAFAVGGSAVIEAVQQWFDSNLGINLPLTIALMALTAHFVMVGVNGGQPYRKWLNFLLLRFRSQPSGEGPTPDGKEVAKMMLRAANLDEVERLRTQYMRGSFPEGRLFERFVNKAYRHRLEKAGERDKAAEFYDVVESRDKDSVREDIEFSALVVEADKEQSAKATDD